MAPETSSLAGHHLEQHHQQHYNGTHDATRQQQRHQQPEHGSLKDPRLRLKTYKRVSKALPPDPLTLHKQRAMKSLTTVSTAICFFLSVLFPSLVHVSLKRSLLVLLFPSLKRGDWNVCNHIHHHRKKKKHTKVAKKHGVCHGRKRLSPLLKCGRISVQGPPSGTWNGGRGTVSLNYLARSHSVVRTVQY